MIFSDVVDWLAALRFNVRSDQDDIDDMHGDVKESLEILRQLSAQLNETTQHVQQVVSMVEKFLRVECGMGLPCYELAQTLHKHDGSQESLYLAYDRLDGKFRLAVDTLFMTREGQTDRAGLLPWTGCSREVQMITYQALPNLLRKMAEETKVLTGKTCATGDVTQEILNLFQANS